jgi:hypothetical protein
LRSCVITICRDIVFDAGKQRIQVFTFYEEFIFENKLENVKHMFDIVISDRYFYM